MLANVMESAILDALSRGLISAGLPCLLLAIALWWIHSQWKANLQVTELRRLEEIKRNETARGQELAQQKLFIDTLNAERNDRLSDYERRQIECEKDRFSLREQLIELLKQDRTVVRALPHVDTSKEAAQHSHATH